MSVTAFLEARDFLLSHREDYDQAYRDFRWPELDRFNWALDYFDPLAQGNGRPALVWGTRFRVRLSIRSMTVPTRTDGSWGRTALRRRNATVSATHPSVWLSSAAVLRDPRLSVQ